MEALISIEGAIVSRAGYCFLASGLPCKVCTTQYDSATLAAFQASELHVSLFQLAYQPEYNPNPQCQ